MGQFGYQFESLDEGVLCSVLFVEMHAISGLPSRVSIVYLWGVIIEILNIVLGKLCIPGKWGGCLFKGGHLIPRLLLSSCLCLSL